MSSLNRELDRKFRVLQQTLSMQSVLRDRYARLALGLDLILLACSVVFCATTFASDAALKSVYFSSDVARSLLGWASVLAFFASLASLLLDWKSKAGKHGTAAYELGGALSLFRDLRKDDGIWPPEKKSELERAYWDAMDNDAPIPDRLFPHLKAQHLRKIQVSKMVSNNPGCPVCALKCMLLLHSFTRLGKVWRNLGQDDLGQDAQNGTSEEVIKSEAASSTVHDR